MRFFRRKEQEQERGTSPTQPSPIVSEVSGRETSPAHGRSVVRITPTDSETVEEWVRGYDGGPDDDLIGVDAVRNSSEGRWQWSVVISALEFVREDPLETEFSVALLAALQAVPGALEVVREDREVFVVDGTPSGAALGAAACAVVDAFESRLRIAYDELG